MQNLSFTACSFHFRKAYSKKNDYIYGLNHPIKFQSNNKEYQFENFIDIFKNFFKHFSTTLNDKTRQRTYSVEFNDNLAGETDEFRYICAKICSGIYGSSTQIVDVDTEEITYEKSASESEVRPFYMFIVFPKDNEKVKVEKGMIFYQNIGQFGIKTVTTGYMIDFFSSNYGITFKSNTIAPELFIKKIITRDNIKKIQMIRNEKSSDTADLIFQGYGKETRVLSNLRFTQSLWEAFLNKMVYCSKSRFNLFEFEGQDYDNLKVVIKIGENNRTINLHNLDNLSIIENLPDEIKDIDGHPKIELLLAYFLNVTNEYLKEMVLQIS